LNAKGYLDILEAAGIPALPSFNGIFMDDNAPIHRASIVKDWKADYSLDCISWPPYSPDLSPVENLWGYMKDRLNKCETRPTTLDDLAHQCHAIWNSIPASTVAALFAGMPDRMKMCIRNKGSPINF
jgi:hypothetical protein